MKRLIHIIFAEIFFVALILTACVSEAENKTYFVRDVTDGDTIVLADGQKVRYVGIDTPETTKKKGGVWVSDPEAFGLEAKNYNRKLVLHKNVKLEFDVVREDKYKRWLAYVYTEDGVMVNEKLLSEGYAVLYTFPPNIKYIDTLLAAQSRARSEKKGLWGVLEIITPEEAGNFLGKWVTVRGEVHDIFISPYVVSFSFGDDPWKTLTAVIFTKNLPLFTKEGIDPVRDYKAKRVELVGKIEYRNGPQILIDNPSQIRVLE